MAIERRAIEEKVVASKTFQAERKTITVELKSNARGSFFRITEENGGRIDRVIMPVAGVVDLVKALQELAPLA
jgi:hypothetical protein